MKRILIVGGYCSVGKKLIKDFSDLGYAITATTSKVMKCQEYKDELGVDFVPLDVTDVTSIDSCFKSNAVYDSVVYLASVHYFNSLRNFSAEKAIRTTQTNSLGLISVAKSFLKSISQANDEKDRSIVYMSSIAAHRPELGLLDYSISKSFGIAIVKNLALEVSKARVRVNSVSPGWIESERSQEVIKRVGESHAQEITSAYPLGVGELADVSELVQFLVSEKSKWITGQDFLIDGGRCLK